jgi:hypothetical protein
MEMGLHEVAHQPQAYCDENPKVCGISSVFQQKTE